MADQQIEDLSELTAPASADELVVNDDSDTTDDAGGTPKRMSLATLRLFASELTLDDEYNAGVGNIAKTLVVGKLTPIDLGANNGGTLAANCVITLPSASAGDVCGFFVTRSASAAGSFAQAPGYCAEIANATRINDAAYTSASTGSGKWGLWLPGEMLVFRYLDTGYGSGTAGWYVMYDGRISHTCSASSSQITTNTAATAKNYDLSAASPDNAALLDASNDRINIKRSGVYSIAVCGTPNAAVTDQKYFGVGWGTASATFTRRQLNRASATSGQITQSNATGSVSLAAADNVYAIFQAEETNIGLIATSPLTGFCDLRENL